MCANSHLHRNANNLVSTSVHWESRCMATRFSVETRWLAEWNKEQNGVRVSRLAKKGFDIDTDNVCKQTTLHERGATSLQSKPCFASSWLVSWLAGVCIEDVRSQAIALDGSRTVWVGSTGKEIRHEKLLVLPRGIAVGGWIESIPVRYTDDEWDDAASSWTWLRAGRDSTLEDLRRRASDIREQWQASRERKKQILN